ncbi:PP2C family protein-serine/threonine phosphatase [Anaerococcus marasmi]|uniref:PP2C family protein-serine/threonine phosphatase n=1 Tax=Anaerococcus marasmi TaxID=2057797 RepID=UPI000CF88114|nr:PP2C family protein-serine/threonine phosphatase [Anaerococcus marasmi]
MANTSNFTEDKNFFILNSMDDWVRIVNTNGKTIFINDVFKEACDMSSELKNYVDESTSFLLGDRNKAVRNTTMIEEKLIDERYFSIKSSPIYNGDEFLGIVEVYRDITRESLMKIELFNNNRNMLDDVRFVKKIQSNILPKDKTYGKLILKSKYIPSDELSGDFFDLIKIEEGKYALYIADIMGHGVKASIMTMFIKVTMNAILDKHPDYSPSEILFKLREKFAKLGMESSQYFTAWLGIFERDCLTFSNAGHNCPPLWYSKRNEDVTYLLASGRMISNLIEPDNYDEKTVKLENGDRLLLFSDGAIETKDEKRHEYGLERLRGNFESFHDLEESYKDIKNFTWGKQEDDLSLVQIEYKEK